MHGISLPADVRLARAASEVVLDLGLQPVSNRFVSDGDSTLQAPRFPLEIRVDLDTGLVSLGTPFPIDELRPRFDWLTCFEPEDHLDALVDTIMSLPDVGLTSTVAAYSFKDDSTLERLESRGLGQTWRIDPADDLGITDSHASVETYQRVFTAERARQIAADRGAADVLVIRHVVEHAYDLTEFIGAARALVKDDGYIVWELPDCERPLALGDCTTIWEEHLFYFTSATFRSVLQDAGFEIVHFESVPYPLENSIIAIVRNSTAPSTRGKAEASMVRAEVLRARAFGDKVERRRTIVRTKLEAIRRAEQRVALFGAGHLSVAFLSIMGISDLVDCVIDDNPHKNGMFMPVGNLPIVGSDNLYTAGIDVCLLSLNPQNQPKVRAAHRRFAEQGGRFASIFPGSDSYLEECL